MHSRLCWAGVAGLVPMLALGACADAAPSTGLEGPTVSIAVAPLSLPGVEDVCYGLTVYNGDPDADDTDTVWTLSGVCSGDYGNGAGGDITYIGTCDASVDGNNYVELVLEEVEAGGRLLTDQVTVEDGGDADFVNPCTEDAPCTLDFECIENADVLVPFDLTVMRDANQGFFDIAVDFDDIFCSAKLDTCYAAEVADDGEPVGDDTPIMLLHGYETDASTTARRGHTAVMALACTAGPSAGDATTLYMSDIRVRCGGETTTLDPSAGPGNAMDAGTFDSGEVWQYAVYEGQESLNCGATSCDKVYWNVAIGIEGLPAGCQISAAATATDGPLVNGALPSNATYPVIRFQANLTSAETGAIICQQNPLNGDGSGVTTVYSGIGSSTSFGYEGTQSGEGTDATLDTHPVVITVDPDGTVETATNQTPTALGKSGTVAWSDTIGDPDLHDWSTVSYVSGNQHINARCSGPIAVAWETASMSGTLNCDGNSQSYNVITSGTSATLTLHVTPLAGTPADSAYSISFGAGIDAP